jgi:hypothetical protein
VELQPVFKKCSLTDQRVNLENTFQFETPCISWGSALLGDFIMQDMGRYRGQIQLYCEFFMSSNAKLGHSMPFSDQEP